MQLATPREAAGGGGAVGIGDSLASAADSTSTNDTQQTGGKIEVEPIPNVVDELKHDSEMSVQTSGSDTTLSTTSTSSTSSQPLSSQPSSSSSSSSPAPPPLTPIPPFLRLIDDLLFGPTSNCSLTDVGRWRQQGFTFSTQTKTLFGLTQFAGGPCKLEEHK